MSEQRDIQQLNQNSGSDIDDIIHESCHDSKVNSKETTPLLQQRDSNLQEASDHRHNISRLCYSQS